MGKFTASLRLPGDSNALAATVQLQEGRLQVASGEHVIGDWEIAAIDISRVPEGIRVAAEGEVLLLDIDDRAAFEAEAASLNGRSKRLSRPRKSTKAEASRAPKAKSAKTATARKPTADKTTKIKGESRIDTFLERSKERFGSRIPDWVFTRRGLFGAIALLAVCLVFARQVSYLLLIIGVIGLLTGGVTMLDSVIARRILRHRVSPIQVVIAGGSIFVTGLVVGVVGNQLWG